MEVKIWRKSSKPTIAIELWYCYACSPFRPQSVGGHKWYIGWCEFLNIKDASPGEIMAKDNFNIIKFSDNIILRAQ